MIKSSDSTAISIVNKTVELSLGGRAPNNEPAIFISDGRIIWR